MPRGPGFEPKKYIKHFEKNLLLNNYSALVLEVWYVELPCGPLLFVHIVVSGCRIVLPQWVLGLKVETKRYSKFFFSTIRVRCFTFGMYHLSSLFKR